MISVVIPLYNKEKQIANTLRTVLAQTYQDFEIVIVNDGSTDNSLKEAKRINDPRIRIISQQNAGVSAARNHGIREARGEYIALLDADDEWKPEYLATQVALAKKYPECDVFAVNYECRDESGNVTPAIINKLQFSGVDGLLSNYFEVAACSNPPICSISIMTRKGIFESVGGFPLDIKSGEDLLTWARLACRYKIAYSNQPMAIYFTPTTGPTGKVPVDLTSTHDAVGMKLIALSKQYKDAGVNEYISFWYKMRAAINLRRRNRLASFRCALKSLRFLITNHKSWALLLLSVAPGCIIKQTLGK